MKTFLQLVAESLLTRYGNNLSHLTVVFPGKRASLFLDQALAEASPTPVWTPVYKTISELFEQASPYTLCDTVESVCRLYRSYANHVESPQTLDQFYGWGEILLSDFDNIDKHCVDVHSLFANISDLKRLDDNSYITSEQEKALQDFFKDFSLQENSKLKERFLQLWEKMASIYDDLNSMMRADGVLYEGALQRDVIMQLSREESASQFFNADTIYVFVGFNVLNTVEQALFDALKHRGQALFYWDYDTYYASASTDAVHHEAGYFIRQNLQRYGNELAPECFNNFNTPKQLTFVKASSENVQARYLPQWLSKNLTERGNQTALVLCNEQLLQPVLHSIPDQKMPVNITMGYPFTDTPLYSFLIALVSLQTDGYDATGKRFRHTQVRTLTSHPYIHFIKDSTWKQKAGNGIALLTYLQNILTRIGPHVSTDMIAQESIFIAYTRLNRLIDLMSGEKPLLQVNDTTLLRVLRSVLQSAMIPFHGEPAIGLQVMGVLETRAIDFRHILMLSVGEGYLPKKVADNSFIPYFLRESFGLTTIRHKIAVYAYYFYRLIQRAERITFVYNESNAGIRQNEISRFLRQLLAETNFPIQQFKVQADSLVTVPQPIVKEKTREVMQRLRSYYDNRGRVGEDRHFLSPSAMNAYTTCPLLFYYRYVKGMFVESDPQDGLDAILFGEVFHRAAELVYLQLTSAGDVIRGQDIDLFLEMDGQRLEPFVRQAFREKFFKGMPEEYHGILYIARRVVTSYLIQLLRHDHRLTPFRVIGVEVPQTKTLKIGDMEIDTGGFIDRLDLVRDENVSGGQAFRIVDYKTGGRPDFVGSMEKLFSDTDQKAHYYFQTILYAAIVAEQRNMAVTPCLFFVHKSGAEDYSPKLKLGGQIIHDVRQPLSKEGNEKSLSDTFMEQLELLITEIFDPATPFRQTAQSQACEFCDFRHLCGR